MATVLTEGQYRAEFMLSEAPGFRSREEITLVAPTTPRSAGEVIMASAGGVSPAQATGAALILWDNVDAPIPPPPDPPGDIRVTAIVRDAEVNGHDLIWPAPGDAGAIAAATAALNTVGIKVR
jgi:hypothetical protein